MSESEGSPYEYGSDLHWLWGWGKRLEVWLQRDNPVNPACKAAWVIFRADHLAADAMMRFSVKYPHIIDQISEMVKFTEARYGELEEGEAAEDSFTDAMFNLHIRIWEAAKTICQAQESIDTVQPMPRSKAPNAIADAESDALVKLSEKDFWLVTELPSNIDADLLRCLDDRGLIESRFVVMQNQQKHGGDSTPSSRSPSAWFSPIQKPDMAGGWNEILSKREKNEWNHPFEVRISERGRAELARRRWAQEGSTEWQEANARPQRQPGQDDSSALRSMAAGLARLSDAIDELHETGVGPLDATLRPVRQRIIASAKALAGNTAAVRDAVQRQGMLTGERKSDLADLSVSLAFISGTLRVSFANNYGFRMTSEMAPEQCGFGMESALAHNPPRRVQTRALGRSNGIVPIISHRESGSLCRSACYRGR